MRNNFNWYDVRSNPEMDKYIEKANKLLQSTQSGEWDNVRSDENGNTILNYTPPKGDKCLIEENSKKEYDSSEIEIDKNKDIEKLKKLLQSGEWYKVAKEDYEEEQESKQENEEEEYDYSKRGKMAKEDYEEQGKEDPKEEDTSSRGGKLDQKWGGLDKRYADDLFYAGSEKGEIVETDEYAIEKLDSMKDKFNFIAEKLGLISSLILDANELGINVLNFPGYFDFAEFYNRHMTELDNQKKIDFTELSQNINKFYWVLERAVHERQNQPSNEEPLIIIEIDDYEIEKLNKMKNEFKNIADDLDYIQGYLSQAKALGINVNHLPGYFDFTEFYANCMTEIEDQGTIDFTKLSQNINKFHRTLENTIT